TTLTVTIPQSDHLTGRCKKRPALLGEVDGGRALATTRLYPALFSTGGFSVLSMAIGGQLLHLGTKPSRRPQSGARVYGCHPIPQKPTQGRVLGQTACFALGRLR
ncbi:MAG: hypothetical protein PHY23_07110, partial [Oscillospiraceae bacterium]|nr:hypothetical protein [Oscillospiraceae bacterium]